MNPQLTIEAFAEFCEKQPPEKAYPYFSMTECACAQYAASMGLQLCDVFFKSAFWPRANNIAREVRTFGALAARLRAVSP